MDLQNEITALATPQHKPEAVSVLVAVPDGIDAADGLIREAAALVAKHDYPGRRFGSILFVEQVAERVFECAVECSRTPFSAVTIGGRRCDMDALL